jgi:putative aldouronate transport system permease protein
LEKAQHINVRKPKIYRFLEKAKRQWFLLAVCVPVIAYIFIFEFYPIYHWRYMFYDYHPGAVNNAFVGWYNFQILFSSSDFWRAFLNTIVISVTKLVLSTLATVVFAVFLNELPKGRFKKLTQTISYLPHFISWAVVATFYVTLLKRDGGVVNNLLGAFGIAPVDFLNSKAWYVPLITGFSIWKEMGWGAIVYLSAMSGINRELYEAAYVDGAGRFKRIWHITLPGISTTILVLTIMNIGWMLNTGFEQSLLLGNNLTRAVSDVLGTYIYNMSLGNVISPDYALAITAGSFQSVASIILLLTVNTISKKINGVSVV